MNPGKRINIMTPPLTCLNYFGVFVDRHFFIQHRFSQNLFDVTFVERFCSLETPAAFYRTFRPIHLALNGGKSYSLLSVSKAQFFESLSLRSYFSGSPKDDRTGPSLRSKRFCASSSRKLGREQVQTLQSRLEYIRSDLTVLWIA